MVRESQTKAKGIIPVREDRNRGEAPGIPYPVSGILYPVSCILYPPSRTLFPSRVFVVKNKYLLIKQRKYRLQVVPGFIKRQQRFILQRRSEFSYVKLVLE